MRNNFPNREIVEQLRRTYPVGTRVELISMHDPYTTLKPGDRGDGCDGGQYRYSVCRLGLRFRPWRCLWRRPHP